MKDTIIYIFILALLLSCNPNNNQPKQDHIGTSEKIFKDKKHDSIKNFRKEESNETALNKLIYQAFLNIDLHKILKQNDFTSGSGGQYLKKVYPIKEEEKLGKYFLINKNYKSSKPYWGEMFVTYKHEPWKSNDNSQRLLDFIIYSPDFNFLEKLKIGNRKEEILNEIGNPSFQKGNYFLYRGMNNIILSIEFKSDTVYKYRIGKYKSNDLQELYNFLTTTK